MLAMKAIMLPGTLKRSLVSNIATLFAFLSCRIGCEGVQREIVKLVGYKILAGTYSDIGEDDERSGILKKILSLEIVILAASIW